MKKLFLISFTITAISSQIQASSDSDVDARNVSSSLSQFPCTQPRARLYSDEIAFSAISNRSTISDDENEPVSRKRNRTEKSKSSSSSSSTPANKKAKKKPKTEFPKLALKSSSAGSILSSSSLSKPVKAKKAAPIKRPSVASSLSLRSSSAPSLAAPAVIPAVADTWTNEEINTIVKHRNAAPLLSSKEIYLELLKSGKFANRSLKEFEAQFVELYNRGKFNIG